MNIEKIGKFIKELRNEKNISQNELSEEMHVTRQAISNWENGKAIPDSDILLLLSSYFEVSINEILSGERNTSENNLQDITLQLIDENNSKKRKIKRILFTSTILITSLLVFFLGYYFINNYNSIKVYSVNGKSDFFKTYNGIFVTTRNKFYLRLGKIRSRGQNDIDKVNKVSLFYLNKDNKKVMLLENDKTDILLDEDFGYKEYFYSNNLNTILNNMYLEITYNENDKEIIKLRFDEKFKNNYLFKKFEKQKVVNDDIAPETILKKDRQLEELLSYEKAKVDELMKKRKALDTESKTNENQPEQIEKVIYIDKTELIEKQKNEGEENNEKEESTFENGNSVENNLLDTENNKENDFSEEVEDTVNIEELVSKIKEQGTYEFGMYSIIFQDEHLLYSIVYVNEIITIDVINNNEVEEVQIYENFSGYSYKLYIDYNENEFRTGKVIDDERVIEIIQILINKI